MPCIGGVSWTTIHAKKDVSSAIALFLNSTYGMLIRIGYAQSTDPGRSLIQIRAIPGHPIPNFAEDSDAGKLARSIASDNFDELLRLPLDRISLSALDPNRAKIDEVVTKMLGIDWNLEMEDMLATWRRLMCQQPAVHNNTKETIEKLTNAGILIN